MRLTEIERPDFRDPSLDYEEVTKPKTSDNIDSVIVYLTGKHSEKYTKLAKRFKDLKEQETEIKRLKDELNATLKDNVDALFPEADDVFTRIVDTASLVLKVGKAEKEREIDKFDANGYIDEINEMFPELAKAFKQVRDKFTTTSKLAAKSPKLLTPKLKEPKKESIIREDTGSKFMQYVRSVTNKVMGMLKGWDAKFSDLNARIDADIRS